VGFCLVTRRRGREEKTRGQSTLLIYSFSFLPENRGNALTKSLRIRGTVFVTRENKTSFNHNKINAGS
jgi:hypothetical protein